MIVDGIDAATVDAAQAFGEATMIEMSREVRDFAARLGLTTEQRKILTRSMLANMGNTLRALSRMIE